MFGQRSFNPRIKPYGPASLHPTLRNYATSVWMLNDILTKATDAIGVNPLTFGSTTAQPTWGQNNGGQGLTFDGGDTCEGTIASSITALPVWVACSITVGSVAASQATVALGSNGVSLGAFFTIFVTTTNIAYQCRTNDGSGGMSPALSGPAAVIGNVYHCAAISRGDTDHTLFVNGQRYTSTSSAGPGFGATIVNAALGELKRSASSAQLTGALHWAAFGQRDPGDAFLRDLTIRPYDYLYAGRANVEPAVFAPTAAAANEEHFLMMLGAGT